MNTLEKFRQWQERNETHMNRFLRIMQRQVQNQRDYVDLFRKLPANSVEFKIEVERLYDQIVPLLDDFREVNNDLASDVESLQEIFEEMRKDIDKLPEDWGKNE